jgi:putative transposase
MYYTGGMQRNIDFSVGEYYHIYNRGVDKRHIYLDLSDKERMLKLLYVSNGTKPFVYRDIQNKALHEIDRDDQLVAIGAYCMMPNHFHILVKETREGGMTSFMEKLTTAYSMYFNKKSKRTGFLFESNFKAQHVDTDEYLKYLYAYIHLNPVKLIEPEWKESGIRNLPAAQKYLEQYRFSSYADYAMEKREESAILTPSEFPDYFEQEGDFAHFVKDWLDYKDEAEEVAAT